jgi:hypothetical protein
MVAAADFVEALEEFTKIKIMALNVWHGYDQALQTAKYK